MEKILFSSLYITPRIEKARPQTRRCLTQQSRRRRKRRRKKTRTSRRRKKLRRRTSRRLVSCDPDDDDDDERIVIRIIVRRFRSPLRSRPEWKWIAFGLVSLLVRLPLAWPCRLHRRRLGPSSRTTTVKVSRECRTVPFRWNGERAVDF